MISYDLVFRTSFNNILWKYSCRALNQGRETLIKLVAKHGMISSNSNNIFKHHLYKRMLMLGLL